MPEGIKLSPASRLSYSQPRLIINKITWHGIHQDANTLRQRQNGRHFADDTFKRILLNKNARISIRFSLKFYPKSPINNIPALVQIMAWRWPGDKPLSEPMVVSLTMHICIIRPQWVNTYYIKADINHWNCTSENYTIKNTSTFPRGQRVNQVMTDGTRDLHRHWVSLWLVTCLVPSHYLNQRPLIVNQISRDIFKLNFIWNVQAFIQENAFENVICKMAAILSRPQCVCIS